MTPIIDLLETRLVLYDLFICHASEDKDSFVRPLAKALRDEHVEVWYDEFTLELGDSIRRTIDKGLRQSRFGIIIISPAFFNKKWTQYELDGLIEIEMREPQKVLLPIWHGVGHKDVINYSPALANRKAISSEQGLDKVIEAILRVVKPQGSPLVEARDLLLRWGVTPPVITDPYWLDVVEASNRVDAFGAVPRDESVWGRWTFPLPTKEGGAQKWGERLAWTAMQMKWSQEAEARKISPLTPCNDVLSFINSQQGLYETCEEYPDLLIEYAPQLTIPGFSGDFEGLFEKLFAQSIIQNEKLSRQGSTAGTGLTIDSRHPLCDVEWALRHPTFGGYEAGKVADMYFSGGMFGPPVSPYDHTDHLVWLLSENSAWLPSSIRKILREGISEWGVWIWYTVDMPSTWSLYNAMTDTAYGKAFRWSPNKKRDVISRFQLTIHTLQLPETPEELLARFIDFDFVGKWISSYLERSAQRRKNS